MNSRRLAAAVDSILQEAISEHAFPGAVLWLGVGDQPLLFHAVGMTAYDDVGSKPVQLNTLYDIASLTKLFTMTAVLMACRLQGESIDKPLHRFIPAFNRDSYCEITLRHLLNHSSGIRFAVQSLVDTPHHDWNDRIVMAPLATAPGSCVHYSCTNYFLLARALEAVLAQPLNRFIDSYIIQPLGMKVTTFWPRSARLLENIAPTEIDVETGAAWHGVVHDEAARIWSAVTGTACSNAGLFSTAGDLARFAQLWVNGGRYTGQQLLHPEDVRAAFSDTLPEESYRRGLCWQMDASFYMGFNAPGGTAGHTGFTGPTLILNPETKHICIILENRVYPNRNGPNRMPYHRRIAETLFSLST